VIGEPTFLYVSASGELSALTTSSLPRSLLQCMIKRGNFEKMATFVTYITTHTAADKKIGRGNAAHPCVLLFFCAAADPEVVELLPPTLLEEVAPLRVRVTTDELTSRVFPFPRPTAGRLAGLTAGDGFRCAGVRLLPGVGFFGAGS
jgi:hypothetical protein